jgi:hypothetical protein
MVEFHSGEISPGQVVMSRIQPAPAFQIATIVWRKEVGNGVEGVGDEELCPILIICSQPPVPLR